MNNNYLIIFLVFVLSLQLVLAEEVMDNQSAMTCLENSEGLISELSEYNFSTERVNDILKQGKNNFEAQKVLEESGRVADYSLVHSDCDTIEVLHEEAFTSLDALNAFKKFYLESDLKGIDTSSVDAIIVEIEDELFSERYEKIHDLVDEGYAEVLRLKSENTAISLFYQSTTNSLRNFVIGNWQGILMGIILLIIFFFIYRASLRRVFIKRKMVSLELRRNSIQSLIMETQKRYFEKGDMSETDYTIRTKNFADMVRDIDRQIPLLKEQLYFYGGKKIKSAEDKGNKKKLKGKKTNKK